MNKFHEFSLSQKTDELKRLIAENPDLPIVVLAGEEANGGDYPWMFCSCISFDVGEILDCEYLDYDDAVFTDRERLEEVVADRLYDNNPTIGEEEFNIAVAEKVKEFEPYWKKVIAIYATN